MGATPHAGGSTGGSLPRCCALSGLRGVMAVSGLRPTARYRPVSIPDDVDDPSLVKASGRVVLPLHIHWSGHPFYDLRDRGDRKRVYQQVLAEGLDDDVRYYIDVAELADLWYDTLLPTTVREAWGPWLRERGWLP